MRSAWYGFHDGVVGSVSDWCLCKDFDQGVKCREVYIPSFVVSVQVVQFAPNLFCVLLRVEPVFFEESFLNYAIVCHYNSCWFSDVLDCTFEIGYDGSLQKCEVGCDTLRVFFFWLRREVSVVVGAHLCLAHICLAVRETLRGEEACFCGLFRLRPRYMVFVGSSVDKVGCI